MTTTEKVRLVDQHREEHGLNRCLKAIGLPKSTYGDVSSPAYRKNRSDEPSQEEQELMDHVREIIGQHPSHGYRRILPELEERAGQTVNHKRVRRLLGERELGFSRQVSGHRFPPCRRFSAMLPGISTLWPAKIQGRWRVFTC